MEKAIHTSSAVMLFMLEPPSPDVKTAAWSVISATPPSSKASLFCKASPVFAHRRTSYESVVHLWESFRTSSGIEGPNHPSPPKSYHSCTVPQILRSSPNRFGPSSTNTFRCEDISSVLFSGFQSILDWILNIDRLFLKLPLVLPFLNQLIYLCFVSMRRLSGLLVHFYYMFQGPNANVGMTEPFQFLHPDFWNQIPLDLHSITDLSLFEIET